MAAEHEIYRLPIKYNANDYITMVNNLLPTGRLWNILYRIVTRIIQDVIIGGSPEEWQDTLGSEGNPVKQVVTLDTPNMSSSLFGRFLTVFSSEFYRTERQVTSVLNESIPGLSTIVGLLPRWEYVLGLTEVVAANPSLTEIDRQRAAHEKYTNTGVVVTEEYLVNYAANLGFDIYIKYQDTGRAFVMGLAVMGLATFNTGVLDDTIEIHFLNTPTNIEMVKDAFDLIIPAHLIVLYIID